MPVDNQSVREVASALRDLGKGTATSDPRGAIEFLAISILEGAEKISGSLECIADAIREHAQALHLISASIDDGNRIRGKKGETNASE
jgi:hypothetical protein